MDEFPLPISPSAPAALDSDAFGVLTSDYKLLF